MELSDTQLKYVVKNTLETGRHGHIYAVPNYVSQNSFYFSEEAPAHFEEIDHPYVTGRKGDIYFVREKLEDYYDDEDTKDFDPNLLENIEENYIPKNRDVIYDKFEELGLGKPMVFADHKTIKKISNKFAFTSFLDEILDIQVSFIIFKINQEFCQEVSIDPDVVWDLGEELTQRLIEAVDDLGELLSYVRDTDHEMYLKRNYYGFIQHSLEKFDQMGVKK